MRPGALPPRRQEEEGEQPKPEPDAQSANSCRSPNSGGSRGRGRGSWVLPPYSRPRSELRRCERERRARPWSQNPPSVPAAALAAALLPRLGTRASGAAVAGAGAVASRVPPAASAPPGEPAPGRRRADGRARAGCKRGSCSPTDWRCPAGRLKGAPTSRPPAPPRPARGRERPAPPARARRSAAAAPRGELGGGWPRGRRHRSESGGRAVPPAPSRSPPAAASVSRPASGRVTAQGPRLGQKFVPGHGPPGVGERGGRDSGLRPRGRGGSDPGAGRQCRRAGPEAPGVAGPALPGGCGPGEPADPGAARVCGFSAPGAPRSWRAPGQLAAAAGTETPQRTGSPAGHPRSCTRNLAPSEQDTLGRFIASQPSLVGPSEPRAVHGRRRSHGPT